MANLLFRYLKDYKPQVVLVVVFALAEALGQSSLPRYFNDIVQNGVAAGDMAYVWRVGGVMLAITAGIGVCMVLSGYFSAYVTAAFTSRMRGDMFRKIQRFSEIDFGRFSRETLLTRSTTDTTQMQFVVINMLRSALSVPFLAVFALINCFILDAPLSLIMVGAFVLCAVIVQRNTRRSMAAFTRLQSDVDGISTLMNEKLTGARSIRAFNRQEYEVEKLTEANEKAQKSALRANSYVNFLAPLVQIIMNLAIVFILWFGSVQMQQGLVQVSKLITYIQYCLMLAGGFSTVMAIVNSLPKAQVSAGRVREVLDYEPVMKEPEHPVPVEAPRGEIEFSDIQFGYTGAQSLVLRDINLTIPAGKTTAIVGATGSGKSTLIKLILRFFETSFYGSIRIDGVDIRDMGIKELRGMLSYAPQKAQLFSGSVLSNLRVAKQDATVEEAQRACDMAQVSEFLAGKNETVEMPLLQGGLNLSGGQRQRVSLARAFIKDAAIYLLDDSFSALDFKTDAAVRRAMSRDLAGKTILIVAQRLNTILHADQIVVLDAGRIAGCGTHEQLLESCELYREIYETQAYQSEGGAAL